MTAYLRAEAAGVRKAPRHEIAVGWAPGGGSWLGYGDLSMPCELRGLHWSSRGIGFGWVGASFWGAYRGEQAERSLADGPVGAPCW